MKKDTLRILITLECNRKCEYCCNNLPEVNSKFETISLIDFLNSNMIDKYDKIYLTGGEPMIYPELLFNLLLYSVGKDKECFVYTNGEVDYYGLIWLLTDVNNISSKPVGLNVTIHDAESFIDKYNAFKHYPNVRFHVMDDKLPIIHDILSGTNYPNSLLIDKLLITDKLKIMTLNECDMPNEDIILLT